VLPVQYYPDLDRHSPLPTALYALYQREYGINLVAIDKRSQALLLKRMRESADWQGLYEDRQSVVLTRRKPL
jgi:hypothetical protein